MAEILVNQETAESMIESAMLLLGVLASGQSANPQEKVDGLADLNRLLDSWNQRRELIYEISRHKFTLTADQNPHTIGLATGSGSNGNMVIARPQMIEDAALIPQGTTIELPVTILSNQQYRGIRNKELSSTSPTDLWYEREWPLGNIWLWPKPSDAAELVLWVWNQLPSGMILAEKFNVPPGYRRAIRYNLAVEIASRYGKKLAEADEIMGISQSSVAHLAGLNLGKRMDENSKGS